MLFYASRNRDLNSIHVLIRIKISLDNSSLYKAAWEFYINIIETLIISKKCDVPTACQWYQISTNSTYCTNDADQKF
jgi:hypothetical protein